MFLTLQLDDGTQHNLNAITRTTLISKPKQFDPKEVSFRQRVYDALTSGYAPSGMTAKQVAAYITNRYDPTTTAEVTKDLYRLLVGKQAKKLRDKWFLAGPKAQSVIDRMTILRHRWSVVLGSKVDWTSLVGRVEMATGIPVVRQHLLFEGREVPTTAQVTVGEYGFTSGATIYVRDTHPTCPTVIETKPPVETGFYPTGEFLDTQEVLHLLKQLGGDTAGHVLLSNEVVARLQRNQLISWFHEAHRKESDKRGVALSRKKMLELIGTAAVSEIETLLLGRCSTAIVYRTVPGDGPEKFRKNTFTKAVTVNLSTPDEYSGGEFIFMVNSEAVYPEVPTGAAVVCDEGVVWGREKLLSGTSYVLVAFRE